MNSKDASPSRFPYQAALFALLLLTAVFVLFFQLGTRGFENKDTARYTQIVWEMLRSGDYLVPRFNGIIFTEKPVLLIWLIAFFSNLAGAITPLTARLPSALSALGCVIVTTFLGKRLFGWRGGLLAGFVLCTNYAFAWEARASRTDMLLTFFITLTLYYLYLGYRADAPKGRFFIAAYVAAGLAALTKGPIGLGLPVIVFFLYLLWRRRLGLMKKMHLVWGVLIVLAIQAAWYAPFLVRIGPEGRSFFYEMYVYKENLLRFTTGFDHYEPPWFYFPAVLGRFLPWSPFLLFYPFLLLSERRGARRAAPKGVPAVERDWRFPAAWFLGILVFLSVSSGKHSRYAVPLYPAAALLVADFWDRLITRKPGRAWIVVVPIAAAVMFAGAIALPIAAHSIAPGLVYGSLAASIGMLLLFSSLICAEPENRPVIVFAALAFSFTCGWSIFVEGLSSREFDRARQQRLATELAPVVRGQPLTTYGPTEDRFGRRLALGFYLGIPVNFIDRKSKLSDYLDSEERVFCLMRRPVYKKVKRRYKTAPPVVKSIRYKKYDLVLITNSTRD